MNIKKLIKSLLFKTILYFLIVYFFIYYRDLIHSLKSTIVFLIVFMISELLSLLYDNYKQNKNM